MKNIIGAKLFIVFLFLNFYIGCTEPNEPSPVIESSTLTDIDGNVYKTVKIGKQWWMAEDLIVKRYRNGDAISFAREKNDWIKPQASYCLASENSTNNSLLYNHYVVESDKQIAPEGWHVPSDEEWKQLEIFIGLPLDQVDKTNWRGNNEGEKLMVVGGTSWNRQFNDPVWGIDLYGFSAKANGCRMYDGPYGEPGIGSVGLWWSSSLMENKAWYRHMDYKKTGIFRYFGLKNYGFSIRCVKD